MTTTPTATPSAPATATSHPALAHLAGPERDAVLWLATVDGFKMARHLSPETLRAVYADLVRAGQYKEPTDERQTTGDAGGRPGG